MTSAAFHRLTRAFWADDWRSGIVKLLEKHGYSKPSRMTLWRWDNEKAPSEVMFLLEKEAKRSKQKPRKDS
jgi:hypothetical protein